VEYTEFRLLWTGIVAPADRVPRLRHWPLSGARSPRPDGVDLDRDTGWTREVTFMIGPHPAMTDGARRMTGITYGMEGGVVAVTTRACLAPYLKRRYGLQKDPNKVSPKEQQIVLLNRDEVDRAMREAG
jgi:hypothetical protein